jgi:hypothetical protein
MKDNLKKKGGEMEDNLKQNGRKPEKIGRRPTIFFKWKTALTKIEDDLKTNGRQPKKWKTTSSTILKNQT